MPYSPTSPLGKALESLRTLIASSASFQAWVGAASLEAALEHVHLFSVETPNQPFVVIDIEEWKTDKLGEPAGPWGAHGAFWILWEARPNPAYSSNDADAGLEFIDRVDAIAEEMRAAAGQNTAIALEELQPTAGPGRTDKTTRAGADGDRLLWEWEARF